MKSKLKIGGSVLWLVIALEFSGTSLAAQFDASYLDLQSKNLDQWTAEDKQINAKLAALESI
jgi:hypothetical protein